MAHGTNHRVLKDNCEKSLPPFAKFQQWDFGHFFLKKFIFFGEIFENLKKSGKKLLPKTRASKRDANVGSRAQ
jgi:hypothetical protein